MLVASPVLVQAQGTIGNPQFIFSTNNGVLTLTKYNGQGGNVVIPGSMYGMTVVGIAESTNGVSVFSGLMNSVSLPSSITNISDAVLTRWFYSTVVDPLNPSYSSVGGSLYSSNQATLIRAGPGWGLSPPMGIYYTVASNITSIADTAFQNWTALRGVFFQSDAPAVGLSAFAGATNLTVYYLAGTTGWGTTFGGRPSLCFDPLFPFTYAINNGAITITGYTRTGGAIAIPETMYGLPVTSVGDRAFEQNYPNSITIGNNVTNIGARAFIGCSFMHSVSIGTNVVSIEEGAFALCYRLTGVYFRGNAPSVGLSVFEYDDNATVYYLPETTGWQPTFGGRPTALWQPTIQTYDTSFGIQTNQFGFNISWASGMTAVVDACTNLANPIWTPLHTNTFATDSFYFGDPDWINRPTRFYRVRRP